MINLGLTTQKAQELLDKYGENLLPSKKTFTALELLISQLKNFMSLLLVAAALLSFLIGDKLDGFLILAIFILNVGLGFWQEYKASKELEALRKLEVANSRVLRDGKEVLIPSYLIVPGDVIILEAGDKVPADAVLIESHDLMVNEAALTGESVPVLKTLKDNEKLIFFGTTITSGRCKAVVEKTGKDTKFGAIALTLTTVEEVKTPLEISLKSLAEKLVLLAIIISVLIFGIRIIQGFEVTDVLFTSIALMVAAVPEGLPAIITLVLAIGVHRMYKRKGLIRKMNAIESLGAATVICTDKTGTLTQNKMRVRELYVEEKNKKTLMEAGVLCSSASLLFSEGREEPDVLGDTTEGALLLYAYEKQLDVELLRSEGVLLDEIPFNLKTKMMSTVWERKGKVTLFAKGAPESILPLCKLTSKNFEEIERQYKKLASKGLRVIAFGKRNFADKRKRFQVDNLDFLGLVGIADAPRKEAKYAIEVARRAGIKIIMITGDNDLTAKAIGEELGLLLPGDEIMTGAQLNEIDDEQLKAALEKTRIFARVAPEHKLRIVKSLQEKGEVVAVTGDGVNDGLALKQAQVGVAMGITGTDVAKEASDLIILDDNFATLVSAVEEGRVIYSNIVKVVKFLLAGNLSEIMLIFLTVIANLPTPLLAVQILWINFVTDGFPALALSADSASNKIMSHPPRDQRISLLSRSNLKFILLGGLGIGLVSFLIFYICLNLTDLATARAAAFTAVVTFQMVMVFVLRRGHGLTSNKYLILSVAFVLLMQAAILYFPPLREAFKIAN